MGVKCNLLGSEMASDSLVGPWTVIICRPPFLVPQVPDWDWAFLRKYLLILRKIQLPNPFPGPHPAVLTFLRPSSSLGSGKESVRFLELLLLHSPHEGYCANLAHLKRGCLSISCYGFLATSQSTWQTHPQEKNTQCAVSASPHSLQPLRATISQ